MDPFAPGGTAAHDWVGDMVELEDMLGPADDPRTVDWTSLERDLEFRLPSDYKWLAERYSPRAMAPVELLHRPELDVDGLCRFGSTADGGSLWWNIREGAPDEWPVLECVDNDWSSTHRTLTEYLPEAIMSFGHRESRLFPADDEIRQWGSAVGLTVPDRGRIPSTVVAGWYLANAL